MDQNTNNAKQQVEVAIRTGRVIHFSDGVDEEIEEQEFEELYKPPCEDNIDMTQMPWGPWLSHYAWVSSNKILNVVDAAGETLASFFGITTPKYQLEIDEYHRLQEEKKKIEEESIGWVPNNAGGDIPLVLNEPVREVGREINEREN